ncbi:MAG: hypothetical protein ACYTFG_00710, partial [Planctomycetota bacterium]
TDEKDGLFRLETEHWVVETQISKRFTCETALFMEYFHKTFMDAFAFSLKVRIPDKPKVVVLKGVAEYRKRFSDGSEGNYILKFDEDGSCLEYEMVVFARDDYEKEFIRFYRPSLLHEGAHLLFFKFFGKAKCPIWFTEGVATYFQFWDLKARKFENVIGSAKRSGYLLHFLKAMRAEKEDRDHIDYLLSLENRDWNPDKMGPKAKYDYGLAQSFVDMLFQSHDGTALMKKLLVHLIDGEEVGEILSVAERDELKSLWKEHVEFLLD